MFDIEPQPAIDATPVGIMYGSGNRIELTAIVNVNGLDSLMRAGRELIKKKN